LIQVRFILSFALAESDVGWSHIHRFLLVLIGGAECVRLIEADRLGSLLVECLLFTELGYFRLLFFSSCEIGQLCEEFSILAEHERTTIEDEEEDSKSEARHSKDIKTLLISERVCYIRTDKR